VNSPQPTVTLISAGSSNTPDLFVINTEVPKELVEILQAIVILFAITLHVVFERMLRSRA